jgi:hypothetical protein
MDITAVDALVSIVMILLVALGFGIFGAHVPREASANAMLAALVLLCIAAAIALLFTGMLVF